MGLLRRFHDWLVWSDGRAVYAVLFVFSLLPFAIAPAIGTWSSFELANAGCPGPKWKGLDAAYNWWLWPVVLPGSLWLLRRAARDTFGADAAIMQVVDVDDRPLARRRLDEAGRDPQSTLVVLLLMVVLIVAEFWGVGAAYLTDHCPRELDWTVFFRAGDRAPTPITWQTNLLHVALAYPAQYLSGFFAILTFVLFFRHNWLYLRWIYQRHRKNRGTPLIELNFDDKLDCCFGQLKMRRVFNLQVTLLVITGVAIVVSRAMNVAGSATEGLYQGVIDDGRRGIGTGFLLTTLQQLTDVEWRAVYPDAGQIVLVVMFILVFTFVSMPSLVKFLPFRAGKLRAGGAKRYLAEFIPPGRKNDPDRLKDDEIGELAGKFRRNSFWPAGDNVAQRLFAFVYIVLLFVVLPVPVWQVKSGIVYLVLLIVVALALTLSVFVIYRYVLGWVADILVAEPKK